MMMDKLMLLAQQAASSPAQDDPNSVMGALKEVLPVTSLEEASQWVQTLRDFAVQYGLKLIGAILIFVMGRWIAGVIRNILKRVMKNRKVEDTIAGFVGNIVFGAIMVFVVIAAIGKLGVQTASFVAVIGAAGLAVGLALQGSLSNFSAGFLIILFRPFKAGDYVEAGGTAGIVEEIHIFTTIMKTPDNKKVIVPNSKILGDNITNYSAHPTRRIEFVFGVSYTDDLDKTRSVIQDVIGTDERILKDPEPQIVVAEMADSSVNFKVRVWANTSDYWGVFFDTMEKVKKAFDANDISIPFPQRDVHLFQETPGGSK